MRWTCCTKTDSLELKHSIRAPLLPSECGTQRTKNIYGAPNFKVSTILRNISAHHPFVFMFKSHSNPSLPTLSSGCTPVWGSWYNYSFPNSPEDFFSYLHHVKMQVRSFYWGSKHTPFNYGSIISRTNHQFPKYNNGMEERQTRAC